ncbi:hypothetical protein VTL71DRAFT_7438 [Oculimacula yallundae]|uniref:2-(3-amino-3-carboxypropyl)histidine synthase subunit 2 n=1 Tax=Oculimacula yallundae TaxID=86028 RepID=A0ABR4BU43_9HELO
MALAPTQAPVLSTPESHIFEDPTPASFSTSTFAQTYTDDEFREVFEIERAVREVRRGGYKRVALQFPDGMLGLAGRVVGELEEGCRKWVKEDPKRNEDGNRGAAEIQGDSSRIEELEKNFNELSTRPTDSKAEAEIPNGHIPSTTTRSVGKASEQNQRIRFYILADTSYGSCCVDEIAAEHVSADVVIHYGRSCLSPTTRLPVIYIYTSQPLSLPSAISSFTQKFPSLEEKVLLMADITYQIHIPKLVAALREKGYSNITAPEVVRDLASVVPNRLVEQDVKEKLSEHALWHISEPPKALLLTLASRVRDMYIYPTTSQTSNQITASETNGPTPQAILANTSLLLRRRYALLTTLSTAPILGILINTLSVSDHLSALSSLRDLISRAGKKSYTFVVGKVNAAKLANFSEIGGWVVVGCWESSLIEGGDFYKGVVTPFELGVALAGEGRGWDGSWRGDFGGLVGNDIRGEDVRDDERTEKEDVTGGDHIDINGDEDSDSESEPPVYDLRTGRYISSSRPMRTSTRQASSAPSSAVTQDPQPQSKSLTQRARGDLATINGTVSPGAEFLRTQRTWTGLGSDVVKSEDVNGNGAANVEEGRSGVARGYVVGDDGERR